LKKTTWSSVDTTLACLPSPWWITFVNSQLQHIKTRYTGSTCCHN
jgi:hypothetical protein